jgi:DNA-directed RNA polymerase II subunit RPB1
MEVKRVKSIQFGIFSPSDILAQSVTTAGFIGSNNRFIGPGINDPSTKSTGLQSLADPRLGSMDDLDDPGKFGHIVLAQPIYHIGYMEYIYDILRCVGYYSHRVLTYEKDGGGGGCGDEGPDRLKHIVEKSLPIEFDIYDHSRRPQPIYHLNGPRSGLDSSKSQPKNELNILITFPDERGQQKLKPSDALNILKSLTDDEIRYLGINPKYSRPENLIVQVVPIPPPHVRPDKHLSENAKDSDDLTMMYSNLITANNTLNENMKTGLSAKIIDKYAVVLQDIFANLIDNDNNFTNKSLNLKENKTLQTLTQRLVGKGGRVRSNLMGKRVDYTARSVITAEPNLSMDQLGVPEYIARNLTVPERVNSLNIQKLTQLVKNGPKKYPGARYLIADSKKLDLSVAALSTIRLRFGDIVERHLADDDVVVFNRQPTLHKMSMMGHRVKVLPGLTFRLNLSVTTPYNADFDGDEMNMHVPQSIEAATEISELMMTNKVVVSSQNNRPVMGIVQDSLLSSFLLTSINTFLTKDEIFNAALSVSKIGLPAIIFPKTKQMLWTGKQLFQTILPESLNISNKFDIADYKRPQPVNIKNGQLLSGIMDKNSLGNVSGSLIHIIYNDMGPEVTKNFFNNVQRITQAWSFARSFSIGIYDVMPTDSITKWVDSKIIEAKQQAILSDEESAFDILSNVRDKIGNYIDDNTTFKNGIKCTVTAGSKGSKANITQVMSCVGQQNVNGKRIRYGFTDRTLPHYPRYDNTPESRGFVASSYSKGLNPQEFFFHAMGGRVGGIDTGVLSVTSDTKIIVMENSNIKVVEIGEWIDSYLDFYK